MNDDEKITAFRELVESAKENIKKQIFLQDKFGEDYVWKKGTEICDIYAVQSCG